MVPLENSFALLSVGSPFMIRMFGFVTFHAEMQSDHALARSGCRPGRC